jgi:glutamyl/glutaminyl-tRNA synthetase
MEGGAMFLVANTRFNPTTNGELHIGHAYMALVNQAEARHGHGKFIVRFEDDNRDWLWRVPHEKQLEYARGMIDDLAWLGIEADEYQYQSQMEARMQESLLYLNGGPLKEEYRIQFEGLTPLIPYLDYAVAAYNPHMTAERVIYDAMSQINYVIRGEDLITEYSLYYNLCDRWGIARPEHAYLARLVMQNGGELCPEISKTSGRFKIKDFRNLQIQPEDVLARLRIACLVDPQSDWLISNLKKRPVWNG